MKVLLVVLLFAVAAFASRGPAWVRGKHADATAVHHARFILHQRNLDVLAAKTLDISDPDSPNYSKWMTNEEIDALIAPDADDKQAFIDWVSGLNEIEITEVRADTILFEGTVRAFHQHFNADMYYYTRQDTARTIIRGDYSIPSEWRHIVHFIAGMTELPMRIMRDNVTPKNFGNEVQKGSVIPDFIRGLYGITAADAKSKSAKSSLCLAEFQDDASFSKVDLGNFARQMGEPDLTVTKIVGPYSPDNPDAESTLDVQYGSAIGRGAEIWFWTVQDWMLEFSQDLFKQKDGPLVVSMSWGWPEDEQCQIVSCGGINSETYVNRVNTEWNKITATGVTLLASSGDQGSPGDNNPYCQPGGDTLSNIFPGASPWVTSVGATMAAAPSSTGRVRSTAPICSTRSCATLPATEEVCTFPEALITTGGGFSTYSSRPTYQAAAVQQYFRSGVALPPAKYFNQTNRGFPDVSGLGHNYLVDISGSFENVDGTSCSAPIWGGMVALLNGERLAAGKTSLGFLNPVLYKMAASVPAAFNDISTGNNKCTESCCNKYGFDAAKGWDPVTGLGTPNYGTILTYIKSLA